MDKEIITCVNTEIKKCKFYHCKNQILLKEVDIEKIKISGMVSYDEKKYKYFIGYKDGDHKI